MVAGSARGLGMNRELFLQLLTEIQGGFDSLIPGVFRDIGIAVMEIENFLKRTEVILRSPVTFEAPAHGLGLGLINHFHLIYIAVAALAGNPAVHMSGVIEIDVVGSLVNAHPLDGLAIIARIIHIHGAMERSKFRTVFLNVLVAVPACIAAWHVGVTGNIHE